MEYGKLFEILNELYQKNKNNGYIGVTFSELSALSDGQDAKEISEKCDFIGYVKFFYSKELSDVIDSSFFGEKESPIGFLWEGCFVKKEDESEYKNLITKSKEYIKQPYIDTCDEYFNLLRITKDFTKTPVAEIKKSIVVQNCHGTKVDKKDEEKYFQKLNMVNRSYYKYLSGSKVVREMVFDDYAKAMLTVNLRPLKPHSKETSAIVGGALFGSAGAVVGYMSGKDKEEKYEKSREEYLKRESERRTALSKGPTYHDVTRHYNGELALVVLPMGIIPILIEKNDIVTTGLNVEKIQRLKQAERKKILSIIGIVVAIVMVGVISLQIYKSVRLNRVKSFLPGKTFVASDGRTLVFIDSNTCKINNSTYTWEAYLWQASYFGYDVRLDLDMDLNKEYDLFAELDYDLWAEIDGKKVKSLEKGSTKHPDVFILQGDDNKEINNEDNSNENTKVLNEKNDVDESIRKLNDDVNAKYGDFDMDVSKVISEMDKFNKNSTLSDISNTYGDDYGWSKNGYESTPREHHTYERVYDSCGRIDITTTNDEKVYYYEYSLAGKHCSETNYQKIYSEMCNILSSPKSEKKENGRTIVLWDDIELEYIEADDPHDPSIEIIKHINDK